jgi:hypothetical protein
MVKYIPCYSAPELHWDPLPATRLASRKLLIEQNIKTRAGPALCVLRGHPPALYTAYMLPYICTVRGLVRDVRKLLVNIASAGAVLYLKCILYIFTYYTVSYKGRLAVMVFYR